MNIEIPEVDYVSDSLPLNVSASQVKISDSKLSDAPLRKN